LWIINVKFGKNAGSKDIFIPEYVEHRPVVLDVEIYNCHDRYHEDHQIPQISPGLPPGHHSVEVPCETPAKLQKEFILKYENVFLKSTCTYILIRMVFQTRSETTSFTFNKI
jgi:hypothetical protein